MPRLARFVPAPLVPLLKAVRSRVRAWTAAPLDAPLAPADQFAEVVPLAVTFTLPAGASAPCPVTVTNHGQAPWRSAGRCPVTLNFEWLSAKGIPLDVPVQRGPFPGPVYPGEAVTVPAELTAPAFVGHALVRVTVGQPAGPPFRTPAGKPVLLEAHVTGRPEGDIDYYKAYATADLTRDYWTVVGPKSKAEFDALAEAKLGHLRDVGLTPDSRVLDVGCGTGQLAVPLEPYLSDRGCYTGTDIGPEAVAFCRGHFRRPNFAFHVNAMTRLPLAAERFDIVAFFSVFTHTFPDETVLLLAEARRLLAPGGVVIGDVFTSPVVERSSGHRGMMTLEREHFLRLVTLAGLTPTVMHAWDWSQYTTREVFTFRPTEPA